MSARRMPESPQFSRDDVISLLRSPSIRLVGNKALPGKADRAYDRLATILNRLAYLSNREQEPEGDYLKRIGQAIRTIADLLPGTRTIYEGNLQMAEVCAERFPADTAPRHVETARRELAAFDSLIKAIEEAIACGLPIGSVDTLAPRIKGETDLILSLELAIESSLPDCGVAQRHRFISHVVQKITGKDLSREQIRDRRRKKPGQ